VRLNLNHALLGDIQLTLLKSLCVSAAVIVTTPQKLCVVDVEKVLKHFIRVRVYVVDVEMVLRRFVLTYSNSKRPDSVSYWSHV